MKFPPLLNIFCISLLLYSCTAGKINRPLFTFIKHPPKRPYLVKNTIELQGGKFNATERQAVLNRLSSQLDDSSKVNIKDALFILHTLKRPVAYDTGYSAISAFNMQSSMYHLGYFNAKVKYTQDTSANQVSVKYTVIAGKPTLIDTLSYKLKRPELERIAIESKKDAQLVKNNPFTKTSALAEISRLVDSFRNNGYYKFTASELRLRGDTSIAALTTVSDDPFEQLRLLNEAQQKRDSPTIKLYVALIIPDDTTKLQQYSINKIYILSDFRPDDLLSDTVNIRQHTTKSFIVRNHEKLFRTALFSRNITMHSGDMYRQEEYYKTLTNLSNLGVWQSVNIRVVENLDLANKIDLIIELLPAKKFGFEASLEASYSATSNTNAALGGNLFGLSANFSLLNRNIGKEAIRMTHNLRAGVELNNGSRGASVGLINSNDLSYTNNISIPRLLLPKKWVAWFKPVTSQTFVNTGVSYNNRLNLFSLQSLNLNLGGSGTGKKGRRITGSLNSEFSYLFNISNNFKTLLDTTPFLRYSYNTSFILGPALRYQTDHHFLYHPLSISKEEIFTINAEESGLLPILKKYRKHYIKADAEYKYTVARSKTAFAFRVFGGVGIPQGGDSTLPFFKQYFGGGSNSMRAWPVRGIGRGAQKLAPYKQNIFNERTGDIQLEFNTEFRHDIARIIPDLLTLKGAVFIDMGNIWNFKNSLGPGMNDPAQFKLANLYKEFGLCAGYGFRFDFNYLVLRTDFGFRFKRPETSDVNNGWKAPSISFNDAFKKLFSAKYRQWRYENFNFTIGINYPF